MSSITGYAEMRVRKNISKNTFDELIRELKLDGFHDLEINDKEISGYYEGDYSPDLSSDIIEFEGYFDSTEYGSYRLIKKNGTVYEEEPTYLDKASDTELLKELRKRGYKITKAQKKKAV